MPGHTRKRNRSSCGPRPRGRGGALRDCDRQARAHKAVRLVRAALQARLLRRTGRLNVIHVSAGQAARYGGLFPSHATAHVLPVLPLAPSARTRAEAGGRVASRRGVVFVGRMVAEKGVLELAEAARRTGTACTFLGSGPLQAQVAARYPEHDVRGWVGPAAVKAAVRAARAVVAPSRWPETACLAAAEPLAEGTPVALADVICSAHELADGGGAVAFDASTGESLDAMLTRIGSAEGWGPCLQAAERRAAVADYADDRRRYFQRLEAILGGR